MKTLEELSRTSAAFVPFQKNKHVSGFLRHSIIIGKVDPKSYEEFRKKFIVSVKQIDRKWTETTWRICTESDIENALIKQAWEFLTSKSSLLTHLISNVSTWNGFVKDCEQANLLQISVDNLLTCITLVDATEICKTCMVLRLEEAAAEKGFVWPPLIKVMFTCLMINNMTHATEKEKEHVIKQYLEVLPTPLSYSDKFAMAGICKSLFVLDWLWNQHGSKGLKELRDDLALYLIPKLGSEDMALIRWLCDKVVDVARKTKVGDTLMHIAVKIGDRQLVEGLLSKGADANAANNDGKTPLHKCAEAGNADIVELLLDKGAVIEKQNMSGSTALHKAAYCNQIQVIEILLDRGAVIESVNIYGNTPLLSAVKIGRINAIDVLLKRGAKTEVKNLAGNTPLDIAIEYFQIKAFEMLINRCNADIIDDSKVQQMVMKTNKRGETVLHVACRNGLLQSAKYFINAGVNVALTNCKKRTALHEAAWNSHYEIVELLLPKLSKQSINAQDENGKTALHFAAEFNKDKIIVCSLLNKGAGVNLKSKEGKTALDLAKCNHQTEIIDELLKRM